MRWVGPKFAALQLAPVRVVDCCRGLAACPPSWVELIFCRHAVACLSSIGPTLFSAYFSAFPDGDSKVCVCVCVCVALTSRMVRVDVAARDVFQFLRFWNAALQIQRFWNAAARLGPVAAAAGRSLPRLSRAS